MSLCFATASGVKALALSAFTLVWTHSIAKVDWQEDWRVTPAGLELTQARVKGTGPGMEPPPEARLVWIEQVVAFIAALCLLGDFRFSDAAGFILAAAVVLWQWRRRSHSKVAAA